ncbi:tetratricopeptide repeat protein [Mesorhizobium sp. ZC-5]|uniref:tetratricopeptide repeat protein n=1 Tax=Mesorhizobium sp. ZC-5 TaxID=2986066 RepID=UPI0021E7A0BB|nr:tetratricopeptide repeat protein [Mesorhizobium sp. ZC-5]MCV3240650.1 tetratricopeptide repeat protein [Mesorhizobium sp. ZC-5]
MKRTASLTTVALAMFAALAQAQGQESLLALCTESPVTDRTIEVCSQLLEKNHQITPHQRTEAFRKRAFLYYRQGNFDGAISDYDEVIQSDPKDSFSYTVRGEAYRTRRPGTGDVRR